MKDVVLPDASASRPCWWLHVSSQIRTPLLTYLPASLVGCGLFHPAHAELSFMVRMRPENRKTLHHNERNSSRYSNPDLCMGLRGSCRVLHARSGSLSSFLSHPMDRCCKQNSLQAWGQSVTGMMWWGFCALLMLWDERWAELARGEIKMTQTPNMRRDRFGKMPHEYAKRAGRWGTNDITSRPKTSLSAETAESVANARFRR